MLAEAVGAQMPHAAEACGWPAAPGGRSVDNRIVVSPDTMIVLRQLLLKQRFAELDAQLVSYDSAAAADVRNEDAWQAAYRTFHSPTPELGLPLDDWVKAAPRSHQARIARAYHRLSKLAAAAGYRSGMVVLDTGPDRQRYWASKVKEDLDAVLRAPEPPLQALLALAVLMQGDREGRAQRALDAALERSPNSVVIREFYSRTLRPVFGGSLDTMRAFALASQRYALTNSRLKVLLGYPAWDEAYELWSDRDTTRALVKINEALAYGDAADFRYQRAMLNWLLSRDSAAMVDLECAVALSPWRNDALAQLGLARIMVGAPGKGEHHDELQVLGMADLRMATQLNGEMSVAYRAGRFSERYLRSEVVEKDLGIWRSGWLTLRGIFGGMKALGLLALVSFANLLVWRRHRFYLPKYVHFLAAGALALIFANGVMFLRAGGILTARHAVVVAAYPLFVYFVFITYGGAKASFEAARRKKRMGKGLVAKATIALDAPARDVWRALTDPVSIKQYMFGTTVESRWRKGSPITWKGEWQGKPYEDKGVVLDMKPSRMLQYTHFSPLAGKPDKPENYHTVTITLSPSDRHTRVTVAQDNNATEEAQAHSEKNWTMMLAGLKKVIEGNR
jgi:uncharacterized protein YndB with AHSA1/START domain